MARTLPHVARDVTARDRRVTGQGVRLRTCPGGLVVRALLPLSLLSACTSTYLPPHGPPVDAAARRVCASGDTVEGIDVSYWQGDVDWDRVARTDLEFAIVRVSDGGFADPEFADNWSELRRVGAGARRLPVLPRRSGGWLPRPIG
jgi:hypothetical protein